MLKALHILGEATDYTDTWRGIQTNVRTDVQRSCSTVFIWGPYWNRFEPTPGAYELDRFAFTFRQAMLANQDGMKVAMAWVNPYPLKDVNAHWTAGDPKTGAPLDISLNGPWARLVGFVLLCLNGKSTWGDIRKCAVWNPNSIAGAEAFNIPDSATARVDFSVPWGEMNASNPANDQKPGVVDPAWQASLMRQMASITQGLASAGYHPAMPLGPALLDGPPHNIEWGSGTNLIPSGTTRYVQYKGDSYSRKNIVTRDSTCDLRANNHVVPGYTWDQYAIQLLGHLKGWKPPVPFGWAHHAYSDISSGPMWSRSTTEGLTRLLAQYKWYDLTGPIWKRRGRVWLTEEGFQGWNDQGVVRSAPGVYQLQLTNVKNHFTAAADSGLVQLWAQYPAVDSVRYPADGAIAWLGLESIAELSGVNRHSLYDWFLSFKT